MNLEMSFFEIYNEKIHDLLGQSSARDKTTGKKSSVSVPLVPVNVILHVWIMDMLSMAIKLRQTTLAIYLPSIGNRMIM